MKGLTKYSAKVVLAWGEAISGNTKIRDWLMKSKYRELGIFCFALNNHDPSRTWLMENKFAHLLAVINGIERKQEALDWLGLNGFYVLRNIALAADGFDSSKNWLKEKHPALALIAQKMEIVKRRIDDKNYDPHRLNP